jgi:hypothetical protein
MEVDGEGSAGSEIRRRHKSSEFQIVTGTCTDVTMPTDLFMHVQLHVISAVVSVVVPDIGCLCTKHTCSQHNSDDHFAYSTHHQQIQTDR